MSLAAGIARFKVVEPQLAGGSLPEPAGWSFLADKGYRTVLDLRPRGEVRPGDDAAAHHAGLRYVILPVTPDAIGSPLLKRFDDEIAQSGNRPLYFFDQEGARASVLWYLHQVATRKLDEATAAKEAEELGPRDTKLWLAAATFLESIKPKPEPPDPTSSVSPPAEPHAAPAPDDSRPEQSASVLPPVAVPHQAAATDGRPESSVPPRDPTAWRPYAAMLLTGLCVPLAFLGRTAIGTVTEGLRRASLPAPATRPRSLPASSGE
jgi:uncharacterized protein (TIGR01244 family)